MSPSQHNPAQYTLTYPDQNRPSTTVCVRYNRYTLRVIDRNCWNKAVLACLSDKIEDMPNGWKNISTVSIPNLTTKKTHGCVN